MNKMTSGKIVSSVLAFLARATHPEVHPLVQHPLAVELTQEAGGGDAEGGVRGGAASTGHVAEEVVPQLSQQPRAAEQRDRSTGLEIKQGQG